MEIQVNDAECAILVQQLSSLKRKCEGIVLAPVEGKGSGSFYEKIVETEGRIGETQILLQQLIENTCSFLTYGMEAMRSADRAAASRLDRIEVGE